MSVLFSERPFKYEYLNKSGKEVYCIVAIFKALLNS